jgi:hypothetical protein
MQTYCFYVFGARYNIHPFLYESLVQQPRLKGERPLTSSTAQPGTEQVVSPWTLYTMTLSARDHQPRTHSLDSPNLPIRTCSKVHVK